MPTHRRRQRALGAPDDRMRKADDRHPYGGVRPEPAAEDSDVDNPRPRPALRRRRHPRARVEAPYSEPRGKNRPT